MSTIAVYCGSASGARPGYFDAANLMGRRIAESGHTLVYGGGDVGLMGAVAFIALPGGVGTREEIIEVFGWTQLGLQQKPCGFLNVAGFYSKLIEFLESMINESFMKKEHLEALLASEDVDDLLKLLTSAGPSYHAKW